MSNLNMNKGEVKLNSISKPKNRKSKDFKIPEEKFKETLEIINQDLVRGKEQSEERRCSVSVHHISPNIRQSYKNISFKQLEEARLCVLQRDWINLAKILAMAKPSNKREHILFFQVFVRYAAICLIHNPHVNLWDIFTQAVASCSNDMEKEQFLNSLLTD